MNADGRVESVTFRKLTARYRIVEVTVLVYPARVCVNQAGRVTTVRLVSGFGVVSVVFFVCFFLLVFDFVVL